MLHLSPRKFARARIRRLIALAGLLLLCLLVPQHAARAQESPPPNFKVAFVGDQGLNSSSVAVLKLIKAEGAQAVLHSGDLDYADDPAAWEAQVNSVLGESFPYFASIGNHDAARWGGPDGYQQRLKNRFARLGIAWGGDLGVESSFRYRGVFFVLTAPGIEGYDTGRADTYIREQLAADSSIWSVCSWHKNMRLMQAGGKGDETGWGVYEEARKGGAIIATAHEHSYSRTHLLGSMAEQAVAGTSATLSLTKGRSFAFVSGLGGHSIRGQLLSGGWWASIYAATCLAGDAACQPRANYGALFGVFNVDGQPNKAFFYFKDIDGRVIDGFIVISNVEGGPVPTPGDPPVLLTEGGGARAVALDSVTWLRGPFSVLTPHNFSADGRTRVMLFAANAELRPGEGASVVTAQAEDSQGRVYPLPVEYAGRVPGFSFLTQVNVRLPDELAGRGDVWVSLSVRGVVSNKALVSVAATGTR